MPTLPNLVPPGGTKIQYEVRYNLLPGMLREKLVVVDIDDAGSEALNKALVLAEASLTLNEQGIQHWTLKSCTKVTS